MHVHRVSELLLANPGRGRCVTICQVNVKRTLIRDDIEERELSVPRASVRGVSTEAAIANHGRYRPNRTVTTSTTWLVALTGMVVGVGVLLIASFVGWINQRAGLQNLLNNIGGTIIASVSLAVLWELIGRRAFTREILETATYAADIEAAGIVRIGTQYLTDPKWDDLFRGVSKLDIFFAYGRTWRNSNLSNLRQFAARSGCRLRVFLPNPDDPQTVSVLAKRFSKPEDVLQADISEAAEEFKNLTQSDGAQIEVYYRAGDSLFSCYRFDQTAILTLYAHQQKRVDVPTVVCRSGGTLYEFIFAEMHAILAQSARIFPPKEGEASTKEA